MNICVQTCFCSWNFKVSRRKQEKSICDLDFKVLGFSLRPMFHFELIFKYDAR